MVTLQQFKEKIIELFADDYYTKNEIDTKESTITGILSQKADKTNATHSNAGLMSAEDKEALDALDIIGYLNDYDYLTLNQLVEILQEDINQKANKEEMENLIGDINDYITS